ncbi:hypothetical protein B0H21DRAFT_766654 [Amylocystis lapponica]|nr:hypothetical protein B0H21DRAFT_766654 [Amylocystis lapponica]
MVCRSTGLRRLRNRGRCKSAKIASARLSTGRETGRGSVRKRTPHVYPWQPRLLAALASHVCIAVQRYIFLPDNKFSAVVGNIPRQTSLPRVIVHYGDMPPCAWRACSGRGEYQRQTVELQSPPPTSTSGSLLRIRRVLHLRPHWAYAAYIAAMPGSVAGVEWPPIAQIRAKFICGLGCGGHVRGGEVKTRTTVHRWTR